MNLDPVEARILGALAEKELGTPQQYPLSRNALLAAVNQTSNRDPVMVLSEEDVQGALDRLKEQRLVRFVLPSHGRSVLRFRHVLDEALGLDRRGLALLAVLVLRGPQTLGELRARSERLADFESLAEVEAELERLAGAEPALAFRLARRPGQKEDRWCQLLEGHPAEQAPPADCPPAVPPTSVSSGGLEQVLVELRAEMEALRGELGEQRRHLEAQRQVLDALRESLGEAD